jgi:hypothetical protein
VFLARGEIHTLPPNNHANQRLTLETL